MSQIYDDLCALPSVGPKKREVLIENGFQTYADLAKTKPIQLQQQCNIVLASTTQIIDSAIEKLHPVCPECDSTDFRPAWPEIVKVQPQEISTEDDLFCEHCYWSGTVSQSATNNEVLTTKEQ